MWSKHFEILLPFIPDYQKQSSKIISTAGKSSQQTSSSITSEQQYVSRGSEGLTGYYKLHSNRFNR